MGDFDCCMNGEHATPANAYLRLLDDNALTAITRDRTRLYLAAVSQGRFKLANALEPAMLDAVAEVERRAELIRRHCVALTVVLAGASS